MLSYSVHRNELFGALLFAKQTISTARRSLADGYVAVPFSFTGIKLFQHYFNPLSERKIHSEGCFCRFHKENLLETEKLLKNSKFQLKASNKHISLSIGNRNVSKARK